MCDLESVLWFHLECPDYVKKFDEPLEKSYLKRQIYNLMLVPYVNSRIISHQLRREQVDQTDFKRKDSTVEYPEEIRYKEKNAYKTITENKNLFDEYFRGQEDIDFSSRINLEKKEEEAMKASSGAGAEEEE
jgi:hypothetical protein